MQDDTLAFKAMATLPDHIPDILVEGVREGDVQDEAILEEREGTDSFGTIDGLVRDDEITRLDFLGQRTRRRKRNDRSNPQFPQSGDVCSHGDLGRVVLVVDAVASEKRDGDRLARRGRWVFENRDRRRWLAPWRVDVDDRRFGEMLQRVESCPSYHCNVHGIFSYNIT
jgi:hypothetical protein